MPCQRAADQPDFSRALCPVKGVALRTGVVRCGLRLIW